MNTPTIGDVLTVKTLNGSLEGRVRFASEHFISLDQGAGVTAILRHDANSDTWRFGKISVTWTVKLTAVGSLLTQLLAIREKALALGYTLPGERTR
jgi:hypothetical protein